jgi:hypothetical protein
MTDDRLADILRMLSSDVHWIAFEQELMGNLVRVYDMRDKNVYASIRLPPKVMLK